MSFLTNTGSGFLSRRLVPIAYANIFIIWGSTFLAISYGLQGFPPFILSSLRFLAAGLILFAWRLSKGEAFPRFKSWGRNSITGTLILTGGTGLLAWGEQYVSTTEAAIAIATGPFWFIAIDKNNWKRYFSDKLIITGLIIGFAGLLLFLKGSISTPAAVAVDGRMRIIAFAVLALSSVSWVLGSLFSRNYPALGSTGMNTATQLLAAGMSSLLIASVRGEWAEFSLSAVPATAWYGLAFLVVFGSIVAYISYIWLLSVRPPAQVSTHTYINPVVAVFAGWLFLGEMISGIQFAGLGIILGGVLLTNLASYKLNIRTRVRIRRVFRHSLSFR